jgi:hypothetical protein
MSKRHRTDRGVSRAEAERARRLAAAARGELEIWDVTAEPEPAPLGGWVRQLYSREATAQDALMAFDRDLMIRDGWPAALRSTWPCGTPAIGHSKRSRRTSRQAERETQ